MPPINGTTGDDTLNGSAAADTILGADGNDLIFGGGGNDLFYGGTGADTLIGAAGNDRFFGGEGGDYVEGHGGDDTIRGEGGDDTLYADAGKDIIYGEAGNDLIGGGADNDAIYGGDGNDTLGGDAGDDTIFGHADDDLLQGGDGNDRLSGGDGDDTLQGGSGNDTLYGDGGHNVIAGESGADLIYGGTGDSTIYGGTENDRITASSGNNLLFGEQGNDTIYADGGGLYFGGEQSDIFHISTAQANGTHFDGGEDGDNSDIDTLNLASAGPLRILRDPVNPEKGTVEFLDENRNVISTITYANIETIIPCFTPGTQIRTPRGPVPVEDLRPGDMVLTRDDGPQPLRWTGRRDLTPAELALHPHLTPVRIAKGALGQGLPQRDMTVSPQHRMLVATPWVPLLFAEEEVLVPAIQLVGQPGITRRVQPQLSYIHIMFDRHQIILADGAWTESFQPGARCLNSMQAAQRQEILTLFPDLGGQGGDSYPPARRTLKPYESRAVLARSRRRLSA